jgi:hypothetical protein
MEYVFTFSHREPSNQKLNKVELTFPAGVTPYAPSIDEVVNYPLAGTRFYFRGRVLKREVTFQVNAEHEPTTILIFFEMERTIDTPEEI